MHKYDNTADMLDIVYSNNAALQVDAVDPKAGAAVNDWTKLPAAVRASRIYFLPGILSEAQDCGSTVTDDERGRGFSMGFCTMMDAALG